MMGLGQGRIGLKLRDEHIVGPFDAYIGSTGKSARDVGHRERCDEG